jgi:hypothetical protein
MTLQRKIKEEVEDMKIYSLKQKGKSGVGEVMLRSTLAKSTISVGRFGSDHILEQPLGALTRRSTTEFGTRNIGNSGWDVPRIIVRGT